MRKILVIIALVFFSINQVYALSSDGVEYDGSTSGSSATNVNDALNDLYSKLNQKQEELNSINNIGTAGANHILKGYTAYVKGKTVTGTIPSKGAATYTPNTKDQTIASGNYLSGTQTIKGDANLIAANIAKGKTIFGVTGSYTSDANAIAGNILSGKTAYVNGSKITGTIATLETVATNSTGDVSQANATGITSGVKSKDDTTSYLYLGIPKNTYTGNNLWIRTPMAEVLKQLTNKAAATYIPNTKDQTIAAGQYLSGVQTIKGDANLVAANIAKGKSIFGVAGTYTSDADAVAGNILKDKTAYVNGSKITGTIASKGATTYTPGTSNQTIASGNYLSGTQTIKGDSNLVAANIAKGKSIFGVSGTYTSDANAVAANILKDKTAYVNGSKITGTIASKGATTYTPGTSNQTIASGSYLSGTQTIKGDANLVAGNIAKGKTIFGVTGTYTGESNPYAIFQSEVKSFSSYTVIPIISSSGFTVNSDNSITCTTAKTYKIYLASGFGFNNTHEIRYVKNSQATTILKESGYSPKPVTVSVSLSVGDKFYMDVKSPDSVRMVAILI